MKYKKPLETPPRKIKPGHPHAKNLVARYLFNSNGRRIFNYKNIENNLTLTGNGEIIHGGLYSNASGEGAIFQNTKQYINSNAGTIIVYLKKFEKTFQTWQGICVKYNNTATSGNFAFSLLPSGDIIDIYGLLADGDYHFVYNRDSIENEYWKTGVQLSMFWNRSTVVNQNKKIALGVNGKYVTTLNDPGNWNEYTVADLALGNDYDSSHNSYLSAVIQDFMVFNTNIEIERVAELYEEPYAMYYEVI